LSDSGAAFTFMVFSLLFFGASQSGLMCCYLGQFPLPLFSLCGTYLSTDISPNYSSVLNTVGNMVGSFAGLAGPLVVSGLLSSMDDDTAWQIVFLITGGQSIVALIVFYFFQSDSIVDVLNTPVKKS
jgi:MFS family permease